MKLEIDFSDKTIKIKSEINISDFFNELHEILGDKINDFKLIPCEVIYNFPIYTPNTDPIIQPFNTKPYCGDQPSTCCCSNK